MPQKKSASADLSVILIYCLFLFMYQKEQVSLLKHVSFWLTYLLACSFLCVKRNKLLTHHMFILSHSLHLSLFLFLSRKEQVSLKLVSFLHTNNHNKSTTLVDCASNLCDASHFFNCLATCATIRHACVPNLILISLCSNDFFFLCLLIEYSFQFLYIW